MSGTVRKQNEMRIAAEAAEWLGVLQRARPADHEAFARWITESRRHVKEFLVATAIDRVLDRVDSQRQRDVDAILKKADANVVPLDDSAERSQKAGSRSRDRRPLIAGLIAASVAMLAIAVWLTYGLSGAASYRTGVGEQKTIELADGSSVYLNTRSQARIRYGDDAREVELVSGEALFDVKRDAARPFRVRLGHITVQALGTQFNVYRSDRSIRVAVIDGAVQLSTPRDSSKLVAAPEKKIGEEAQVTGDGEIVRHRKIETRRVAAWRQHRLMFRADTLEEIAAEFNRYNDSPQIRVEGGAAGKRRFTGVFNASDPRALVQFLRTYGNLAIEERGRDLVIRDN